jgi:hypothetical protein
VTPDRRIRSVPHRRPKSRPGPSNHCSDRSKATRSSRLAAGALVRPDTLARALRTGRDVRRLLSAHDSTRFSPPFRPCPTRSTMTSLLDTRAVLVAPSVWRARSGLGRIVFPNRSRGDALPGVDAFGCLRSLRAQSALDGVSWAQGSLVESAVGRPLAACNRIGAMVCSLPRASLLAGARCGLRSVG